MAIISTGVLGKATGRIGNMNLRRDNGKTILSSRPIKPKISKSEASVKNRNNFSACTKSCTAVRKIHVLYDLWKSSEGKGRTVLNKQLSVNRSRIKTFDDLDQLILVPAEVFSVVSLQSYYLENPLLKIVVNPILGKKWFGRASVSAQGILFLSGAKKENAPAFQFIPLSSVMNEIIEGEAQAFSLELPDWESHTVYAAGKFILNLIIYNQMGDPVEVSVNLIGDIQF